MKILGIMVRRSHATPSEKKNNGKAMVGWWMGIKPCNCNRNPCPRPGGAACVRRGKRANKKN